MRWYDIVSRILLILPIIDFALAAPVLIEDLDDGYGELDKLVEEHFKTWGKPVDSESESSYARASSNSASAEPYYDSTNVVQRPAPNPASSTVNPDPMWDDDVWSYKGDDDSHWQYTPTSSGYDSDREFMEANTPQPNHPSLSTDSDSSGTPTEPEHEVVTGPPSPNLGSPKEPEDEVAPGPSPSPDAELHSDHQSLGAASQQADLLGAIYAAKGKAKVSRRISGTARDVGNAAQRELEPAERSLGPPGE
jgi:hypothetical protein